MNRLALLLTAISTACMVTAAAAPQSTAPQAATAAGKGIATLPPAASVALTLQPQPDAWWTERHEAKLREKAAGNIELVLMGDSITQLWDTRGAEAYAQITRRLHTLNLGFSGDRTQHLLWRIHNGEIDGISPRKLVLLIGTNNLPYNRSTPEETAAALEVILATLREKLPDTRILVLAILPREANTQSPVMHLVRATNAALEPLAARYGCEYLDIGHNFINPSNGNIRQELMPDHLHPNEAGYQIILKEITPFLKAN